jgi:DNA polymerase
MAKVVALDFETYYEKKGYTLSELTTQQYINDPRFQIIGVAASVNGGEPKWHSSESIEDTRAFLETYELDKKGTITVAHNAMFDGAILEWQLGIKPWMYFCTMMGSRPTVAPHTGRMSLKEVSKFLDLGLKGVEVEAAASMRLRDFDKDSLLRYAAYCIQDVDLCWKIFAKLAPNFPVDELRLLDLTIKKFTRPKIKLDRNVIDVALKEEIDLKADLLRRTGLPNATALRSNPLFAELLVGLGVDPPMKESPTTGKQTHAFAKTDLNFQALQRHPNPNVRALMKARLAWKSSINETRLERFRAVAASAPDSLLAVPILYYGAHPGRFSGLDKLNLQNLGRKSKLRIAMVAPKGYKIVAGDLSQIEARITACLAGQEDLLDSFRRFDAIEKGDRDVYCEFGDKVYARTITKADEKERFVAKTGVLQLGFQSGAPKLFDAMQSFGVEDFTLSDAERVVQTYRNTYAEIPKLWRKMETIKKCMVSGQGYELGPIQVLLGQILLPNNMFLTYPKLTEVGGRYKYRFGTEWRDIYGGKLTENVVQALARIVMTTAELRLAKAGATAALSVHDELVFVIREDQVETFKPALHMALTAPVPWMPNLPINCEIGVGDNYGEAK